MMAMKPIHDYLCYYSPGLGMQDIRPEFARLKANEACFVFFGRANLG